MHEPGRPSGIGSRAGAAPAYVGPAMTPLRLALRLAWWALQVFVVIGVAWMVVIVLGWGILRMFGL